MTTEAEAKKKWCPFVRIAHTMRAGNVQDTRENNRDTELSRCIASSCMVWRWSDAERLQDSSTFSFVDFFRLRHPNSTAATMTEIKIFCATNIPTPEEMPKPIGEGWEPNDGMFMSVDSFTQKWKRSFDPERKGCCGLAVGAFVD